MADEPEAEEATLSAGAFHNIAQKQIMNAAFATLAESKMPWNLVAHFLEAAREVCAGDFAENGRVTLHTMRAEGETWVEAEEAFIGVAAADRETGEDWRGGGGRRAGEQRDACGAARRTTGGAGGCGAELFWGPPPPARGGARATKIAPPQP